ncbi:MAG: dihydrofolate reductase [Patescibacteria group bacterium]
MQKPVVAAVAAIGRNRVLGKENKLLWQIPDDLRRFKELTKGHPVIMGRKTFESIVSYLGGPLPKRFNIVVTRDKNWRYDGIIAVTSVEDALAEAKKLDKYIFIGGGAQIYEAALPYTDKLYLTLIDDEKEGDSFFPAYEKEFTQVVHDDAHEWNGLKYRWVDLNRK